MTVETLSDVMDVLNDDPVKRIDRQASEIGYEDGAIIDRKNDTEIDLDTRGFTSLCDYLKFPKAFARRLPTDLSDTIFERLLADASPTYSLVVNDGVLVGFSNPDYPNVSAAELLAPVVRAFGDDTEVTGYDDNGASVSLEFSTIDSFEAVTGDISRGLIRTDIDRTWKTVPQAEAKVFRLVCSNGMLSPVNDGSKFRVSGKTPEEVVSRYSEVIQKTFQHLTDAVVPGIVDLTKHTVEDAVNLLNTLAAEHSLGKRKVNTLRDSMERYERDNGEMQTYYDFWNFLTYQGTHNHELGEEFQTSLQRVAGHLAVSGTSGCPTCSRPIS